MMLPHLGVPEVTWPELDSSCIGEFGVIDRAVYDIRRKRWPTAVL